MREQQLPPTPGPILRALAYVAPRHVRRIMDTRLRMFRADAARRGANRRSAQQHETTNPASSTELRDRLQIMADARDLTENGGIFSAVLEAFELYSFGQIRYFPSIRDEKKRLKYKEYVKSRAERVDASGQYSLDEFVQTAYSSVLRDGDLLVQIRPSDRKLMPIESDRIGGNSCALSVAQSTEVAGAVVVQGVHYDSDARPVGFDVYDRADSSYGPKKFVEATSGTCWLVRNGKRFDARRGSSLFKGAITRLRDVQEIIGYEIGSVKWGSSVSGVIKSMMWTTDDDSDAAANEKYFTNASTATERAYDRYVTARPGTLERIGEGEDVTQFKNDRPQDGWVRFIELLIREICVACGVPYGFVWDSGALRGVTARLESRKAQRTFQRAQRYMVNHLLTPWVHAVIAEGIASTELESDPDAYKGRWQFAAHPTMDVGRESAANVSECEAQLKAPGTIFAESGDDVYEEYEEMARQEAYRRRCFANLPPLPPLVDNSSTSDEAITEPDPE